MNGFLRAVLRVLATLLGVIAILYLSLCIYLRATSPAWLYDLPAHASPTPPPGTSILTLRASDGVIVHALEVPPPDPSAPVAVVFHGNEESIADWGDIAVALRARGMGVVVAEYRGFGVSSGDGSPGEQGLYRDAEAILDALAARDVARERIVLLGQSLGTGVAAEMARQGKGAKLVLISPYTAILDLKPKGLPLPASLLMTDRFDTLAKAPDIHLPTLILHGDADEEVPFAMGKRLTGAIGGARLHVVAGGHHNDLWHLWLSRQEMVDAIVQFAASTKGDGTAEEIVNGARAAQGSVRR